jgi:dihydropteroate synthase
VALAGIQAGADLINDIWGLRKDENMAAVIAKHHLPCCLMHNREEAVYQNFSEEIKADLRYILDIAAKAGIDRDKIILDPGVGFGKTYENNLETIAHLDSLKELGCPLLLGTSRKSVIGLTLQVPPEERVIGTVTTSVFGVIQGCAFLRVHDIRANAEAVKMAEAILGR